MSTNIYIPQYILDMPAVAEQIPTVEAAGWTIVGEEDKHLADHVVYCDQYKDADAHRTMTAYKAPQLVYYFNRFVFTTAARGFKIRVNTTDLYTVDLPVMQVQEALYPISLDEVHAFANDDNKKYTITHTMQKYEDAIEMSASEARARFTQAMIDENLENRGKTSTQRVNRSWLIEEVNTLGGQEVKEIHGIRSFDNVNFIETTKIYEMDYNLDAKERNALLAFSSSLGTVPRHPFVIRYVYDGTNMCITDFKFMVDPDFPRLDVVFT